MVYSPKIKWLLWNINFRNIFLSLHFCHSVITDNLMWVFWLCNCIIFYDSKVAFSITVPLSESNSCPCSFPIASSYHLRYRPHQKKSVMVNTQIMEYSCFFPSFLSCMEVIETPALFYLWRLQTSRKYGLTLAIFLSFTAPHDEFENTSETSRKCQDTKHSPWPPGSFALYVANHRKNTAPPKLPMREADFRVAAMRPSVTPGVPRCPPDFLSFCYKGTVFYQAPSESSPEDKTKYKSFIWELIWDAAIEDRGKEVWERKAADKRHVIKLARVEAVGQWSSSLLGSSGRWNRTHHRVFPDKEPGSGSICPPTLISHCGRMMEVGGDGGINSGISGWLLVWTKQVSTVREKL